MRRLLLGLFLTICVPSLALAWGGLGHRTVAEIAARYLSKKADAQVQDLLGGGPTAAAMVDIAIWADENVRPDSYPWHTVDIPPDGVRYNRARDCKNSDCIVEKIKQFAQIVGDRRVARAERIDALKYLIHFVGDLHMPLHAYAPLNHPKGTWVRIGERTQKLHLWWDNEFVEEFGSDPTELANMLVAEITADQLKAWSSGTAEDWANESFNMAREFVARHNMTSIVRAGDNSEDTPIVLPTLVIDEVKRIVGHRLKMAGVRLAWLLNRAFKN
jgi:hypothetical protein